MNNLLSKDELREFQECVKHLGNISKELHKHNDVINKKKTSERNVADAISKLTTALESSTEKITSSIDSLITEIKKSRD